MTGLLLRLVATTVAVLLADALLAPTYFHIADFGQAVVLSLVLGLLNAVVRPVLSIMTFPLHVLTFGLFALVLNAALLWLAALLVDGVYVNGIVGTLLAALVISIVGALASRLIR